MEDVEDTGDVEDVREMGDTEDMEDVGDTGETWHGGRRGRGGRWGHGHGDTEDAGDTEDTRDTGDRHRGGTHRHVSVTEAAILDGQQLDAVTSHDPQDLLDAPRSLGDTLVTPRATSAFSIGRRRPSWMANSWTP